ncbi:MAG TPA: flagellar hook capping FlgD N-terminal domain-containing protein [Spirochaetota bacterium]
MGSAMAISGRSLPAVRGSYEKPSAEAVEERKGIFENRLSPEELARNKNLADEVNKTIRAKGKKFGEAMGKDDFMKLLVTEMRHQDPTQPMADREFIAQMTQFSSLEQMQNMNSSMSSLNMKARYSEAYELIGKRIEAFDPQTNRKLEGDVTHVIRAQDDVRIVVNGSEVPLENVHAVYPSRPREEQQPLQKRSVPREPEPSPVELNKTQSSIDNKFRAHASHAYNMQSLVPSASAPKQSMIQE